MKEKYIKRGRGRKRNRPSDIERGERGKETTDRHRKRERDQQTDRQIERD